MRRVEPTFLPAGAPPRRRDAIAVWAASAIWVGLVAWTAHPFFEAKPRPQETALAVLIFCALVAVAVVVWRWRRQALDSYRRAARFRALVQSSQDLIWVLDGEGRWAFVNDAALRICGYRPDELVGRRYADILAPGEEEKHRAFLADLHADDARPHREICHVRRDGKRVVLLYNGSVVRDEKGRVLGTMGTATDVTYLREMQETLLLNERLKAVATLGSSFAHDFNNILTVIIGQAEVTKRKENLSEQLERRMNRILDSADRARKLTQQLVSFARRRNLNREVIDLATVVREMGDLLRGLAGDDARVVLDLPDAPVRVHADWGRIEQVVMNLVLNARDASERGGCIAVAVRECRLARGEADALGLRSLDWAALEVTDEGSGMDDEVKSRIFDPFFTTKEQGQGTGLGLATVHGVVEQHGGRITVESTPGRGTRMRVLLPAVGAASAAAPAVA